MKTNKLLKYQQIFKEQFAKQLENWRAEGAAVPHHDLYQFLHRIKGTGSTIGLPLWSLQAELLLEDLHQAGERIENKMWTLGEWQAFLDPLLHMSVEGEPVLPEGPEVEQELREVFVLLVSQSPAVVIPVKQELESFGWTVIAMDTPLRAVRSFFRYKPDLLLIDQEVGIEATEHGGYLLKKVESFGIPLVLIADGAVESGAEAWDLVIERPLEGAKWALPCKRLIQRGHTVRRLIQERSMSVRILTGQWNYLRHWLGNEAVMAYLDIEHLKQINERDGYEAGDRSLKRLSGLLHERFPQAALYHGDEDDFYLLTRSDSVARVREEIEDMLREIDDFQVTLRMLAVGANEDIAVALRKLRDGILIEAREETAATAATAEAVTRLAIIDDDEIVRKMLEEQFRKLPGVEVSTYREGESFLQDSWHTQRGPYLLIVDGMMPRMDGFELVYRVRHDYDPDKYAILMLTARKSEKDVIRALELGVDDYVTKPFGIRELEARVRRLLKRLV